MHRGYLVEDMWSYRMGEMVMLPSLPSLLASRPILLLRSRFSFVIFSGVRVPQKDLLPKALINDGVNRWNFFY